jgi:hypothetical protein
LYGLDKVGLCVLSLPLGPPGIPRLLTVRRLVRPDLDEPEPIGGAT